MARAVSLLDEGPSRRPSRRPPVTPVTGAMEAEIAGRAGCSEPYVLGMRARDARGLKNGQGSTPIQGVSTRSPSLCSQRTLTNTFLEAGRPGVSWDRPVGESRAPGHDKAVAIDIQGPAQSGHTVALSGRCPRVRREEVIQPQVSA